MANEGVIKFNHFVSGLNNFTCAIRKSDDSIRDGQSAVALDDTGHVNLYTNGNVAVTIEAGDTVIPAIGGVNQNGAFEYQPEVMVDNIQAIVNATLDEPLTGNSHNEPTSVGRRIRTVSSAVIRNENLPAQTGINNANQIKFDSEASIVDGAYDPARVCIISGDGIGQSRLILEYNGDDRVATVGRNWKVNPIEGDEFIIYADAGREHVNEGLARGGSSNTIILNVLASSSDNAYKNQRIFIRSGTGEDQVHRVITYNGTTKVATVSRPWDIEPDNTSGYVMLPATCVEVQSVTVDALVLITEAIKAMMGLTEGGTWSFEKITTIVAAFVSGDWRLSDDGTKQELLDAEDGETVILTQNLVRSPLAENKYRDMTVLI